MRYAVGTTHKHYQWTRLYQDGRDGLRMLQPQRCTSALPIIAISLEWTHIHDFAVLLPYASYRQAIFHFSICASHSSYQLNCDQQG